MTTMSSPGPGLRGATMRDVAALAGTSLKTVSRVVNAEQGVSPDLSARVLEAVRLLGYRHNLTASSLRRRDRRTSSIGLILDDVSNPFFAALLRAIETVAHSHRTLVFAGSNENDPRRERELLGAFASRRVDGLIATPVGNDPGPLLHEQRLGTPVVFVDRPDESGVADSVTVANHEGSRSAVRHLVAHGHRRIAFLGDRHTIWTAGQRHLGYLEGLGEAGLVLDPRLVRHDVTDIETARVVADEMLRLDSPPTAFFTGQNLITIGTLHALREHHAQHRIALLGFDDFLLADLLEPAVTVVAQNVGEVGRVAAALLFRRVAGDARPAQHVVLPTSLVARGSGELAPPDRAR